MEKKKLYVFGLSDYSYVAARYLLNDPEYLFSGYLVDDEYFDEAVFQGITVSPLSLYQEKIIDCKAVVFSAIGYRSMRMRKNVYERLRAKGIQFPTVVVSGAYLAEDVVIGENSIVMPGAIIEPGVTIGSNVTIWSNVTVCHDTVIGDHSFLAAGSVVGGSTKIGAGCFLGFNSTVAQNLTLGPETLVAAMSYMSTDSKPRSRYQGVPAQFVCSLDELGIKIC